MKPSLNANSSDLERARAVADRVGVRREPLAAPGPAPARLRFQAALVTGGLAPSPPPSGAPVPPLSGNWSDGLARCLARARGRAIVVLDGSALVVASAGDWSGWSETQLEGLGPRLLAALEQAGRIEGSFGECRSLALQAGSEWLTGLRLAPGEGGLVVGLLAVAPLDEPSLRFVEDQVRRLADVP